MISRVFIFNCDDCGAEDKIPCYGLPPKWRAVAPIYGQELKQVCPKCAGNYKEGQLLDKNGKAQIKAK